MAAKVIMVQGTASSVGKSLISAALCRVFTRRGYRVAPFKAQNMSNNAAAVGEGEEIGRAQALQAAAAGIAPTVDMNPVLLKPETDHRSQVVLLGKPYKSLSAGEYYAERNTFWKVATAALDRLRSVYDLVIIEGAGSPAEINLRDSDIVNMAIAHYAYAPVLLVGDIDPGGIFAQFVGTLSLLDASDRATIKGLIINKFRGDYSLLEPGIRRIESMVRRQVLGVVPYVSGVGLAEEDAQPLERAASRRDEGGVSEGCIDIAVIRYPRISNFDDFDALRIDPRVRMRFVERPEELGMPDALILPGTKATLADLAWLRGSGLDLGVRWLARIGKAVVGVCGGYQMLGRLLDDAEGVEGWAGKSEGLGLLAIETRFTKAKVVGPREARVLGGPGFFAAATGLALEGYEIHAGATRYLDRSAGPLIAMSPINRGRNDGFSGEEGEIVMDGAAASGGRVWGSYLHGLFDLPEFRSAWLDSLVRESWRGFSAETPSLLAAREAALDRLADAAQENLDIEMIALIAGLSGSIRNRYSMKEFYS